MGFSNCCHLAALAVCNPRHVCCSLKASASRHTPTGRPQGVCPVAIMMMRQGSGGDRPVAPCLKLLPLSCSDSFSPQTLLLQRKASASTHIPTGVLRGVCPVAITMRQGNRGSYPLAPSKPLRAAPARMRQSARHQAMRATLGPIANGCKFILACGTSYTEVSLSDTHSFICGSCMVTCLVM